jgi:hypothetical protein
MMRHDPERAIERAAAELRRPVRFGSAFDERVMAEVRGLPRHRLGAWRRLLRPRTITVSPLFSGLAAALLFAAAISTGHAIGSAGSDTARGSLSAVVTPSRGGGGGPHDVQFVLVAPTARKVAVVGDFNDWDSAHEAYQAEHRGGGVWSVTAPVPVGHHRYSFVVDDSVWVTDPTAPRIIDDDYGLPNSALVVGETGR